MAGDDEVPEGGARFGPDATPVHPVLQVSDAGGGALGEPEHIGIRPAR